MEQIDERQIAEIMHTIFCAQEHEKDMLKIEETSLCPFYLENSIDRSWEMRSHLEWLKQAKLIIQLSAPLSVQEVLKDIIQVYQISEQFKRINPKLLNFIKILIS